jgi:hypothetical protein
MKCVWLPTLVLAFATTASAQTIVVKPNDRGMMMPGAAEQVRVAIGVNMFVPLSDNGDQALKVQEDSRRMVYNIAAHECSILVDLLASECHLESINVNANMQRGQNFGRQGDGLNINGNVNLRIVPK